MYRTSDLNKLDRFQFPPPRGGELIWASLLLLMIYFNSRPREGANQERGYQFLFLTLFQFPPPRGGEQQNCTK